MDYTSTRKSLKLSGSEVILNGISKDGGLFVPSSFPILKREDIERLSDMDYVARATFIYGNYLTDFERLDLLHFAQKSADKFDEKDPAPVVKVDDGLYVMELWHGPTSAFKDVALTTLPHFMSYAKKRMDEDHKILILVATSGDTGKAALEGFKNVDGVEVVVVYPSEGVSPIQRLQMTTTDGDNVHVIGVKGNFDDAQKAVKEIFGSPENNQELQDNGYVLSSANSINFGRLLPQIVYYVSAYCDLLAGNEIKYGDKINFVVPSGNFGDILAGYYAKKMGLPIKKLIVASNENNVLTDFFNTGIYDASRPLKKTTSPSMDILVSSNLERLLFEIGGRDESFVENLMKDLKETRKFQVDKKLLQEKCPEFSAYYLDENEVKDEIYEFYEDFDYVLDPHTAVASGAYFKYIGDTQDYTPTVIVSTANPYKFPSAVYEALTDEKEEDAVKASKKLREYTGMEMPDNLKNVFSKKVLHTTTCERDDLKTTILDIYRRK